MWKEIKARKDYQCLCCGGKIEEGDDYFRKSVWEVNAMFPMIERYCKHCGPFIKQGLSWRQARIKAYGKPYLKGWKRPCFRLLFGLQAE